MATSLPIPQPGNSDAWQPVLQDAKEAIVYIRYYRPCAFDTQKPSAGNATGFVVNAEKGLIWTSHHITGTGPGRFTVMFANYETVDAWPKEVDGVHDYAFLQFNTEDVKYMTLSQLEVKPDSVEIGAEIRVIGNNAGEKQSILTGVISRLDCNAPKYDGDYQDFNTCYIQANVDSSAGSSGSPVLNKYKQVVGMLGGGRDSSSTTYFLPLDRALRALRCIERGQPVERGSIQCKFLMTSLVECCHLGLTPELEATVRESFPGATNMLVAQRVLPDGPSYGKIKEGDVLLKVDGKLLIDFIELESVLDSSVGKTIHVSLQRGVVKLDVEIDVGDLHAITPSRFVSVAGANFHNLSYQQAMRHGLACKGVFVRGTDVCFRLGSEARGYIIQAVDGKATPTLETFIEVMNDLPDRSRIGVAYKALEDPHIICTKIISINRHWSSKMRLAVRNDVTGVWDFTNIGVAKLELPQTRLTGHFAKPELTSHRATTDLAKSFVHVECIMPMSLDGVPYESMKGMGLVVDAERGLVVVARAIVPYAICDIWITIADSIVVWGKVVFQHHSKNFSVIQYAADLVDAPVKTANLSSGKTIAPGTPTTFIGFDRNNTIVQVATTVTQITADFFEQNWVLPRYRAINSEYIHVDTKIGRECGSGVLVDDGGAIQALWLTYVGKSPEGPWKWDMYHRGLATPELLPVIKQLQNDQNPKLKMLPVEVKAINLSEARTRGVSEEWIEKFVEAEEHVHRFFLVLSCICVRGQGTALEEGDILLAINDKLVTRITDIDNMDWHDTLDAIIVRNKQEMSLQVPTASTDDLETKSVLSFCGATLQSPHLAVCQQVRTLPSEVYVSLCSLGSPAQTWELFAANFITQVNDEETPNLATFLRVIMTIPDDKFFRLAIVDLSKTRRIITMKKDLHYFPTVERILDPRESCGWKSVTHENTAASRSGQATPYRRGYD